MRISFILIKLMIQFYFLNKCHLDQRVKLNQVLCVNPGLQLENPQLKNRRLENLLENHRPENRQENHQHDLDHQQEHQRDDYLQVDR